MSDFREFLSMFPVMYSQGHGSSEGFVVWRWDGTRWDRTLDFTGERATGRPPGEPGKFCGQLRAIVCDPPEAVDGD